MCLHLICSSFGFFFPYPIRTHLRTLYAVIELIYIIILIALLTSLDEPPPHINLNIFVSSYVLEQQALMEKLHHKWSLLIHLALKNTFKYYIGLCHLKSTTSHNFYCSHFLPLIFLTPSHSYCTLSVNKNNKQANEKNKRHCQKSLVFSVPNYKQTWIYLYIISFNKGLPTILFEDKITSYPETSILLLEELYISLSFLCIPSHCLSFWLLWLTFFFSHLSLYYLKKTIKYKINSYIPLGTAFPASSKTTSECLYFPIRIS